MKSTPSIPLPEIGARIRMTVENSNWCVGDIGTITGHYNGGTSTNDRVGVVFDGRQDDYCAFPGDFEVLASSS